MFTLEPKGPYSWEQSLSVLDHWEPLRRFAGGVKISMSLDGDFTPVTVRLRHEDGRLHGEVRGTQRIDAAARQVARIFSLDHDGSEFSRLAERDRVMKRLMALLPGLRPVCFPSPYEAAVWGILSQRISMRQAARLQDRLLEEHGVEVDGVRCLPPPEKLKRVNSGLPSEKIARLHSLADHADLLHAEILRALGDEAGPESLTQIRGIGRFWSQGIYLRSCGIRDVWPEEPIAQQATERLGADPENWRPFRMWACFLVRVADARGLI